MGASTIQGHAGALHVRSWDREGPRRLVVLVHGYGEHLGRYEHVAAAFGQDGAAVWGLDHAGHGRSEGERVALAHFDPVAEDVHRVVELARASHPDLPVVMVGHSLGGMIATRYAELHPGELAGLVLSGPLLGTTPLAQLLALDEVPEIPIDPGALSRDPAVGEAYAADPLVWHGPFKRSTLAAVAAALLEIALDAERITGPVLWQHGAEDEVVRPEDTRRGIALLRNATVQERLYPGARHEIFNETNRDEVLRDSVAFAQRVAP